MVTGPPPSVMAGSTVIHGTVETTFHGFPAAVVTWTSLLPDVKGNFLDSGLIIRS